MSVEIPSALIRQIQAKLRKNAGVPSSYDPSDPSFRSSLPTLDDAISDIDAAATDDPSHLRCGRCRRGAGLLRGPKSTLCIFCGHDLRRDGVVQSISFNSTAACRKLLQSVQLDGSEVVDLNTEPTDSNKRQDTQRGGLVLSTVLDVELKWPTAKEEEYAVDRSFDKAQISVQAVNLSGVDLDTYFSDSKNTTISGAPSVTSEELMPGKQTINTESLVSAGPENFGSFNDFPTSNLDVKLENSKGGRDFSDSFADWDDCFQSASSQAFHTEAESVDHHLGCSTDRPAISATDVAVAAESTSVDLFERSTTEFSTQVAPTSTIDELSNINHEIRNKVNSKEPANELGHLSGSANWIQDDFWPSTSDQLTTTSNTNDNGLKDDVQCMTSADVSWGEDEMWSTSNTHASDIKRKHHDNKVTALDKALDSWQDFASLKESPGVSSSFWVQSGNDTGEIAPTLKSVDLQDIDFGNFFQPESFSGGLPDQRGPNKVNDIQLNNSPSTNKIEEGISVKSNHEIHDGDAAFDDPLDSWEDFTLSTEAPEVSSVSWIQWSNELASNEHASALKSLDAPATEPGNFSQLDSFLGAAGERGGPKKVNDTLHNTSGSTSNIEEILKFKNSSGNSSEAWKNISNSSGAAGDLSDLSNLWTQPITLSTLNEVSGTKSMETQNMESGSILYSGSLSAALGGQHDPREVIASKLNPPVSSTSTIKFDITNQNDDNDDSLDDWQDFTSSKGSSGVSPGTSFADGTSRDHIHVVKHVDPQDSDFDGFRHSGSLSGAFGGHQDSCEVSPGKLHLPVSSTTTNEFDLTKPNDDNDESLDNWQDFTSSKESAGVLPNSYGAEDTSRDHIPGVKPPDPQDSEYDGFLYTGSLSGALGDQKDPRVENARKLDYPFSSAGINEFNITKHNYNDDSLEDWQDFTSLKEAPGVLPNTSGAKATLRDHADGANPVDPRDSQFGSFQYLDSFSGVVGNQCSSHVNDFQFVTSVSNTSKSSNIKNQNDVFAGSLKGVSSSKEASQNLSNLPMQTTMKEASDDHTMERKLGDLGDIEFGDFLQSDVFSGVSHQEDSSKANDVQLDTFVSDI